MCGIAGVAGQLKGDGREIARMLKALEHRGPDGEGIFEDGHAALGHRRLSIIDLEGGRQPLRNAEGSIWLVANGEIYNYRELRAELEQRGHRFLTHSDCEVIIGLYEAYGDKLLERLRGMFAFALWDKTKRRLLVARDHLGQKPLYYSFQKQQFAFASEIKALLALDPGLRQMNLAALDQYLSLRLIASPLSMFSGVHKLPPGHSLVLEAGGVPQVRRYWDLSFQPKLNLSEDALLDEVEERVIESLRLHLVSDVPVGAFLSGGLDSSLLVAMIVKRLGVKDLPTFTIGLPYKQFDEAPYAKAVAERYGTAHHELTLDPTLKPVLPELVEALDEPSDPLSLCTYHLAKFTRQWVKVAIGGDGGDELFGGYDRYYGNIYAGYLARVPSMLRGGLLGLAESVVPSSGWYKSVNHQLRWLRKLASLEGGARYAASLSYFYFDTDRRRELFTPRSLEQLGTADAEAALRVPYESAAGDAIDRMLYTDNKVRLPDHPVMISDRLSMAHGLETRSPFMDHKLVEYVARVESNFKVRGRKLRYLQRRLAERYLTPEILNRPKQGFSVALPYILKAEYQDMYRSYLEDSTLVRDGVLSRTAISGLLQEHLSGRADHGNRLWLLINSEVWYRIKILGHSHEEVSQATLSHASVA